MSAHSMKFRQKLVLPDLSGTSEALADARERCRLCGEPFSETNVYSEAGWIEVGISGICEVCFDVLADMPGLNHVDDQLR